MSPGIAELTLCWAGQIGQASLSRTTGSSAASAALDQHCAAVVAALFAAPPAAGGQASAFGRADRLDDGPPAAALLRYACGFLEAAIGRGWQPAAGGADWESMRLAAVCRLVSQAEPAACAHSDGLAFG
jgi:hypothetical protein